MYRSSTPTAAAGLRQRDGRPYAQSTRVISAPPGEWTAYRANQVIEISRIFNTDVLVEGDVRVSLWVGYESWGDFSREARHAGVRLHRRTGRYGSPGRSIGSFAATAPSRPTNGVRPGSRHGSPPRRCSCVVRQLRLPAGAAAGEVGVPFSELERRSDARADVGGVARQAADRNVPGVGPPVQPVPVRGAATTTTSTGSASARTACERSSMTAEATPSPPCGRDGLNAPQPRRVGGDEVADDTTACSGSSGSEARPARSP